MKTKECSECNGKGKGYFSCCNHQMVEEELAMCPICKEHLGEDICEECNGTGVVEDYEPEYEYKELSKLFRYEYQTKRGQYLSFILDDEFGTKKDDRFFTISFRINIYTVLYCKRRIESGIALFTPIKIITMDNKGISHDFTSVLSFIEYITNHDDITSVTKY